MEKKMENDMETGIILGLYWGNIGVRENQMETTIMDDQMEKMENEMEDGVIRGIIGMQGMGSLVGIILGALLNYRRNPMSTVKGPYARLYPRQQTSAKKRTRGQRWAAW